MIIYEVNHDVEKGIETEYVEWLSGHIHVMLGFKGFKSVEWYALEGEEDDKIIHWCLHYNVESMADLESYLEAYAPKMRAEGADRFGSRYRTSRRIMSLYRHFE